MGIGTTRSAAGALVRHSGLALHTAQGAAIRNIAEKRPIVRGGIGENLFPARDHQLDPLKGIAIRFASEEEGADSGCHQGASLLRVSRYRDVGGHQIPLPFAQIRKQRLVLRPAIEQIGDVPRRLIPSAKSGYNARRDVLVKDKRQAAAR